jgi:glycine dehydrogenase subunit 1
MAEMLNAIGVTDMDALFMDIPWDARCKRQLSLDDGKSEIEVRRKFDAYDTSAARLPLFMGAGAYRHYIPAVVPALLARSEFYTAYTPYQAEMSQGMLQGIFEYQTYMCRLTGMDVSNASVYDGATACAETMIALRAATRKNKILYSAALHPEYIQTMRTYARFTGFELVEIPFTENGETDLMYAVRHTQAAAGMIAASPNFYGVIEDIAQMADFSHTAGILFVTVSNPLSLGLLKRPGDVGADFCVGEGQPLGIPLSAGGPYLGFMAANKTYMRNLPGRIVGQTEDAWGNRAFVLTLQAREQHIRREKASSNICSNQSLCALTAAMYLGAMGPAGLKEVALQCLQKAHYLYDGIHSIPAFAARYPKSAFFHEFVTDYKGDAIALNSKLKEKGFIGGLPLCRYFKGDTGLLFCATEVLTRSEIDGFLNALEVAVK